MPIYGYICQDCHQKFEVIRPFSKAEDSPPPCEFCGSPHADRELGNVNVVFGAGFQSKSTAGGGCSSCSSAGSNTCTICDGGR